MSLLNETFEKSDTNPVEKKLGELIKEIKIEETVVKVELSQLENQVASLEERIRNLSCESYRNFDCLFQLKKVWIDAKIAELRCREEWKYHSDPQTASDLFCEYQERVALFIRMNFYHLTERDKVYTLEVSNLSQYINIDSVIEGSFVPTGLSP